MGRARVQRAHARARCVQAAKRSFVDARPRCTLLVLGLVCWTCLWHSSWSAVCNISTRLSGQVVQRMAPVRRPSTL